MMRHARFATLAIAVTLAIAACAGSVTPAPSTQAPDGPPAGESAGPSAAGGSTVAIANFAFAPASVTVAVGTTVTWTNSDSASHTVTADDGSFKSAKLANGATFSQTFTTAGTFTYHCSIHPSMTATITVR
jgi:plastocyanin